MHIDVEGDMIKEISSEKKLAPRSFPSPGLYFDDVMAFPGLINSHDHLDFNLFPRLGNRIYDSYIEWGADIQKQNKDIIDRITRIPKQLRVQCGLYKNLLNGITTVVHHGEYLDIEHPIINVYQDCHSIHSVAREKQWKIKLNNPFAKHQPFVIHVGECTDKKSYQEINELIRWNLLKKQLIGIHGVSMDSRQANAFEALIWCPDSNYFLLNSTAAIDELKNHTTILFGTDSTVSASWNLWDQLRLARGTKMLTDQELMNALTSAPAITWKLHKKGSLRKDKAADIVIARNKKGDSLTNSFFQLNPEDILLVIKSGDIILYDQSLEAQMNEHVVLDGFSKIKIRDCIKFVKGDLPALVTQIIKFAPHAEFPFSI